MAVRRRSGKGRAGGFTLVEMLIASVIFVVITGAVFGLLQTAAVNTEGTAMMAQLRGRARYVFTQMQREIPYSASAQVINVPVFDPNDPNAFCWKWPQDSQLPISDPNNPNDPNWVGWPSDCRILWFWLFATRTGTDREKQTGPYRYLLKAGTRQLRKQYYFDPNFPDDPNSSDMVWTDIPGGELCDWVDFVDFRRETGSNWILQVEMKLSSKTPLGRVVTLPKEQMEITLRNP